MTTALLPTEDTLITKIAALLRHAEKCGTEAEAAAYMDKAQQLATNSAIDLAVAYAHKDNQARKPKLTTKAITIGQRGKRGLNTYIALFCAIAWQNNLKVDQSFHRTTVYAYGFDTDIEVTEALYTSLVFQMVEASDAYLRTGEYQKEQRWSERHWEMRPVSGVTARLSFQSAFAYRIGERLETSRLAAEREAVERDQAAAALVGGDLTEVSAAPSSVAMVLVEKADAVKDYYSETSDARGKARSNRVKHSHHASKAGAAAGTSARIGGGKAIGGSRTAVN